jgi:sarcosine oxidase subunit beta
MTGPSYDVAIFGGGNLGLWTARGLAVLGVRRIAVLDRGWFGFGATARSAGMIRAQGGTVTAILLGRLSRELYQRVGEEIGLDSGFTRTGYYVLSETSEEAESFRRLVTMRRDLGTDSAWIDADEGRRRVPWFDWSSFLGATFDPDDGYVHPPIATRNITVAVGRSPAVTLFERCDVSNVAASPGGWIVEHACGRLEAERVVLAGGAAGGALARMVGVEMPVTGGRHHVVVYAGAGAGMPKPFPQLFAVGRGFYLRPEDQGVMVGLSRREPQDTSGRFALPIDQLFVDERLAEVEVLVPSLAGQPLTRMWSTAVDYTPDALPIIDEVPGAPGCFVVAGGGHGMMWGPAIGEKAAELMMTGALSDLPPDEVRLARFSDGGPTVHETISLMAPLPEARPSG